MIIKKIPSIIALFCFSYLNTGYLFSESKITPKQACRANDAFRVGGCVFFRTSDNFTKDDIRKYTAADAFNNPLQIENHPIYFVWNNKASNIVPAAQTEHPYLNHYKYIDIASGGGLPKKFRLEIGDFEQEYALKNNNETIQCLATVDNSNYEIGVRLNIEKDTFVLYENKNEDIQPIKKIQWVSESIEGKDPLKEIQNNDHEINIYLVEIEYIKNLSNNPIINTIQEETQRIDRIKQQKETQRINGIKKQKQKLNGKDGQLAITRKAKDFLVSFVAKNDGRKLRHGETLSASDKEKIWNDAQKAYVSFKNDIQNLKRISNSLKQQLKKISNNQIFTQDIKNLILKVETFIKDAQTEAKGVMSDLCEQPTSETAKTIIIDYNQILENLEEAKTILKFTEELAEGNKDLNKIYEVSTQVNQIADESKRVMKRIQETADLESSPTNARKSLPFIQHSQQAASEILECVQKAVTILEEIKKTSTFEEIKNQKDNIYLKLNKARVAYQKAQNEQNFNNINEFINSGNEALKVAQTAFNALSTQANKISNNIDAQNILSDIKEFEQEVNNDYSKAQEVQNNFIQIILVEIKHQQEFIQSQVNETNIICETNKDTHNLDKIQTVINLINIALEKVHEAQQCAHNKAIEIFDNQNVKDIMNNIQELYVNLIDTKTIFKELNEQKVLTNIKALQEFIKNNLETTKNRYETSKNIQNLNDARIINNVLKTNYEEVKTNYEEVKIKIRDEATFTIEHNQTIQKLISNITKSFEAIYDYTQKFQEIVDSIEITVFKEIQKFQTNITETLQKIHENYQSLERAEELNEIKEYINTIKIDFEGALKIKENAQAKALEIPNYPDLEIVMYNIKSCIEQSKKYIELTTNILQRQESIDFFTTLLSTIYDSFNEINFGINSLSSVYEWINNKFETTENSLESEDQPKCNEYLEKFNQIAMLAEDVKNFALNNAKAFPDNEEIQNEVQKFVNLISKTKEQAEEAKLSISVFETKTEIELLEDIKKLKNATAKTLINIEIYIKSFEEAKATNNFQEMEKTFNLILKASQIAQNATKEALMKASKIRCNATEADKHVADTEAFAEEAADYAQQATTDFNDYSVRFKHTAPFQSNNYNNAPYPSFSTLQPLKKENQKEATKKEKTKTSKENSKKEKKSEEKSKSIFGKVIRFFKKLFS